MALAIVLPGDQMTLIMQEVIDSLYEEFSDVADSIFPGKNKLDAGALPGDVLPDGPMRLDNYWAATPDISDLQLIIDPDYEENFRKGLEQRAPVNPFWTNQMRIPGQFTLLAKDFMRLNDAAVERGEA